MRELLLFLSIFLFPVILLAQFTPSDKGLTIIVTDGTQTGKKSILQPPTNVKYRDLIRPLGMSDAIQAGAFIERPEYGLAGFILVFCVNDAIGDQQGSLIVNGEVVYGVYRLIRQKFSVDEEIPEGMTPYRLAGTVYFLGIS